MKGGIGFSRHRSDSWKRNRALGSKKKPMKDNPYSAKRKVKARRRFVLSIFILTSLTIILLLINSG